MLPACAVGPRIAALAIVAECAAAGSAIRLLFITTHGLALLGSIGAVLILVETCAILLVEIGLCAACAVVLPHVSTVVVSVVELRLIVFLVECGGGEIAVSCGAIEIVGAVVVVVHVVPIHVVRVDVVPIDVVAVDIVDVHVVSMVVVVAIYKGVGIRDVHIPVVNNR